MDQPMLGHPMIRHAMGWLRCVQADWLKRPSGARLFQMGANVASLGDAMPEHSAVVQHESGGVGEGMKSRLKHGSR